MDRFSRRKISKDIVDLNSTINQLDLIDICRILHPTTEYAFFSSTHGALTKINHILGPKTHLNKYKLEIIQSIFSDHNGLKLEINYRKIAGNAKMFGE